MSKTEKALEKVTGMSFIKTFTQLQKKENYYLLLHKTEVWVKLLIDEDLNLEISLEGFHSPEEIQLILEDIDYLMAMVTLELEQE